MGSLALEDQLSSWVVDHLPPLPHVRGSLVEKRSRCARLRGVSLIRLSYVSRSRQLIAKYSLLWPAFGLASPQPSLSQTLRSHVLSRPLFIRFRLFCSTLFSPWIIEIVVYSLNISKTISYCQNYAGYCSERSLIYSRDSTGPWESALSLQSEEYDITNYE